MATRTKATAAKKKEPSPKAKAQLNKADAHHRKMISSGRSMVRWLHREAPDELKAVLKDLAASSRAAAAPADRD